MSEGWWIFVAGLVGTLFLTGLCGLIAWMFVVVRDLGSIAATMSALSGRIESMVDDNLYIREKVDEHVNALTDLRMNVTRLDITVSNLQKALPHA